MWLDQIAMSGLYLLIGLGIGVLSGSFGIGGAFILTPILNALGMPMVYAIGTGLTFTVGVSSYGSIIHFREGNLSLKAACYITMISLAGILAGQQLVLYLEKLSLADTYIRWVYIIMLLVIGTATYFKADGNKPKPAEVAHRATMTAKFSLLVDLGAENKVPLWSILFIGLFVGFLKGFMGIGGGFILVPLLIWLLNLKPHIAVGTSLAILFATSIYAAALYFYSGNVIWQTALLMITGSFIGTNFGVKAMKNMQPHVLRQLLSVFLLLSSLGILLKQFGMNSAALVYMLLSTGLMALLVIGKYALPGSRQSNVNK